jgi:hypothetical protein
MILDSHRALEDLAPFVFLSVQVAQIRGSLKHRTPAKGCFLPETAATVTAPLLSPFAGGWQSSTFISYETPAATEGRH